MPELIKGSQSDITAGELLTHYINGLAGETPRAQWFQRDYDGSGIGLAGINLEQALVNRSLDAPYFPVWYVKDSSHSSAHAQMLEDFIVWQSPCLLLLQSLDRETRKRLETQAAKRAVCIEKHYRLYPEIIDHDTLKAARVEAALRKDDLAIQKEEEVMSTYYIELNVTRTN